MSLNERTSIDAVINHIIAMEQKKGRTVEINLQDFELDYLEEEKSEHRIVFNGGGSLKVRMRYDGAVREDIGYGKIYGAQTKAEAMIAARRMALRDGIGRVCKQFGFNEDVAK